MIAWGNIRRRRKGAVDRATRRARRPGPTFVTAAELSRRAPASTTWLVPGYVAECAVTEITGRAKSAGKTTFVLRAVRAVLDGGEFLGRATGRSAVVFLSEERAVTLRQGLARARLLDRDDLAFLLWDEAAGRTWRDVVEAAVQECRRRQARLLVVDTLGQFAVLQGAGENSAADAFDVLGPLQRAAASGLAVVVVRHERKAGGEVGQSARGSTAFTGGADIVVKVGQGGGGANARVLTAQSRFEETPRSLTVELTDDGYRVLDEAAESPGEAATASERVARELLAVAPAGRGRGGHGARPRRAPAARHQPDHAAQGDRDPHRRRPHAAPWRRDTGRPVPGLG